jgi:hypothetical protein
MKPAWCSSVGVLLHLSVSWSSSSYFHLHNLWLRYSLYFQNKRLLRGVLTEILTNSLPTSTLRSEILPQWAKVVKVVMNLSSFKNSCGITYLCRPCCRWKDTKGMDLWKMSVIVNRTQVNLQMKWRVVKLLIFFIRQEFLICFMFAGYEKWY